jgi:hypothetical protein
MPTVPPLNPDALSPAALKRLVIELLVRVTKWDDEIRALRDKLAHLKALPKRPKLAPGGMDKAAEPGNWAKVKAARRITVTAPDTSHNTKELLPTGRRPDMLVS